MGFFSMLVKDRVVRSSTSEGYSWETCVEILGAQRCIRGVFEHGMHGVLPRRSTGQQLLHVLFEQHLRLDLHDQCGSLRGALCKLHLQQRQRRSAVLLN